MLLLLYVFLYKSLHSITWILFCIPYILQPFFYQNKSAKLWIKSTEFYFFTWNWIYQIITQSISFCNYIFYYQNILGWQIEQNTLESVVEFFCIGLGSLCYLSCLDSCYQTYVVITEIKGLSCTSKEMLLILSNTPITVFCLKSLFTNSC